MQINKGDKLLRLGSIVDVIESSETSFTYSYPDTGYEPKFTISKVVPKPLYHDGQVVASKNTGRPFKISRHYAFGNSFRYVEDLSHEGFSSYALSHYYEEEFIRPLTEQEKQ